MKISVYFTAERIQKYLSETGLTEETVELLRRAGVSKVFLEARRGGVSTSKDLLRSLHDAFQARGFETAGGIMTIQMNGEFGTPAGGPECRSGLLCYSSLKTRTVLETEIRKLARLFDEIIVDDAFLTPCRCGLCRKERQDLDWTEFRRELMLRVSQDHILIPAHQENPRCHVIIKFPQYYDRYELFGYDPKGQTEAFDGIWAGTETRDPSTLAFGHVPQYEGYFHYRWLRDIGREKLEGAWFDFLECTPGLFTDQVLTTALAGPNEITLFCFGPEIFTANNPLLNVLEKTVPELDALAVSPEDREGVDFYLPVNQIGDGDLFIGDYLGMWGIPLSPCSRFPESSRALILPSRAAGDPDIAGQTARILENGGTVLMTSAFLSALPVGSPLFEMAGLEPEGVFPVRSTVRRIETEEASETVEPFDLPCDMTVRDAEILIHAVIRMPVFGEIREPVELRVPLLTRFEYGKGSVLVLNLGSCFHSDYRIEESLNFPLVPPVMNPPQIVMDTVRRYLLEALGMQLDAPYGVAMVPQKDRVVLVNYRDDETAVSLNGEPARLSPHSWKEFRKPVF
ncbi:MAG TPA: hypothetical protein PLY86_12840 [bacterium]|nr:hypothetical protein [bacterium]